MSNRDPAYWTGNRHWRSQTDPVVRTRSHKVSPRLKYRTEVIQPRGRVTHMGALSLGLNTGAGRSDAHRRGKQSTFDFRGRWWNGGARPLYLEPADGLCEALLPDHCTLCRCTLLCHLWWCREWSDCRRVPGVPQERELGQIFLHTKNHQKTCDKLQTDLNLYQMNQQKCCLVTHLIKISILFIIKCNIIQQNCQT